MNNSGLKVEINGVEIQDGVSIPNVYAGQRWKITNSVGGGNNTFTFTIIDKKATYQLPPNAQVVARRASDGVALFGGRIERVSRGTLGTSNTYDCTALGWEHLISTKIIDLARYVGFDIFEALTNRTEGISTRGLFYHPSLPSSFFINGDRNRSIFNIDRKNIESITHALPQTYYIDQTINSIMTDISSGLGGGLVFWIDADRNVYLRYPPNIDALFGDEPMFEEDEPLERVQQVIDTTNLVTSVKLTDASGASDGVRRIYGASEPKRFTIPDNITGGTRGVIEVEYNTGNDNDIKWTQLKLEIATGLEVPNTDTQVLWDTSRNSLELLGSISFNTFLTNAVRIKGTLLRGEIQSEFAPQTELIYGTRERIVPARSVVGDEDTLTRKAASILNESNLSAFTLQFRSKKYVPVGSVGGVVLPRFFRTRSNIWLVTQVSIEPRDRRYPEPLAYTYNLGLLADLSHLGGVV